MEVEAELKLVRCRGIILPQWISFRFVLLIFLFLSLLFGCMLSFLPGQMGSHVSSLFVLQMLNGGTAQIEM